MRTMTSNRFIAALAALALSAPVVSAQPAAKKATQPITVKWLGHATFEITSSSGTKILIDPFITGNPATPAALKSLDRYGSTWKPNAILVSHSHSDHSADAKAIAEKSGAPVVSAFEWVSTLKLPDAQTMGGNAGGTFKFGDVTVHIVPAMHSSDPGGRPLGFVLEFADGRTLYHTGDTWVFSDMALIQDFYHPNIILLNVGGGPYTEDPKAAAVAIRRYFKPSVIVPMHYKTFPGLATDADVRAAFPGDRRVVIMNPGDSKTF